MGARAALVPTQVRASRGFPRTHGASSRNDPDLRSEDPCFRRAYNAGRRGSPHERLRHGQLDPAPQQTPDLSWRRSFEPRSWRGGSSHTESRTHGTRRARPKPAAERDTLWGVRPADVRLRGGDPKGTGEAAAPRPDARRPTYFAPTDPRPARAGPDRERSRSTNPLQSATSGAQYSAARGTPARRCTGRPLGRPTPAPTGTEHAEARGTSPHATRRGKRQGCR